MHRQEMLHSNRETLVYRRRLYERILSTSASFVQRELLGITKVCLLVFILLVSTSDRRAGIAGDLKVLLRKAQWIYS